MTNSTFVEGFSTDGSLHYAPYDDDARLSHAHGWSTGPTSLLSFYVAGIRLIGAAGSIWRIEPLMGDLTLVEAGFETPLGNFGNLVKAVGGAIVAMEFETPERTVESVILRGVEGSLVSSTTGESVNLVDGVADGLSGGAWSLVISELS